MKIYINLKKTFKNVMFFQCVIYMPLDLNKAFRKPENCDFCKNVETAVRIYNVSPDEFEENYAYKGGPVLVADATVNWTAMEVRIFMNNCILKERCRTYDEKFEELCVHSPKSPTKL